MKEDELAKAAEQERRAADEKLARELHDAEQQKTRPQRPVKRPSTPRNAKLSRAPASRDAPEDAPERKKPRATPKEVIDVDLSSDDDNSPIGGPLLDTRRSPGRSSSSA